jgi:2,4-dienoyl-CoA reductase-like NADH-dependent reductase (Old Yellow Enzyme family)
MLKNRLIMPPMATSKADAYGLVSQGLIDYYQEKSAGGYISLIIIEHSFISQQGKASNGQLSIATDANIGRLRMLSQTIHINGTYAVMQINHAGGATTTEVTGLEVIGPSAVPNVRTGKTPKEMTKEDILTVIKDFASSARRVKDAGFDGVEIHSAHGYLLNQFFSPFTNQRTDEYGGNVQKRIRIHLEVIKAIRDEVGPDFPVFLRLGACDYLEGGTTIDDSRAAAKAFAKEGVNVIDVSGGLFGYSRHGDEPQGFYQAIASEIKKAVSIPVVLTGGITDAKAADELIKAGKADLIGVGRAILTNSNWAKEAIESLK